MNDKPDNLAQQPERLSLSRWSRRKLEAARAETTARDATPEPVAAAAPPEPAQQAGAVAQSTDAPLPPIESLTIDSEFAAFFKPDVAEATKRAALKQLFRDPRFNIMDGLDVYIDDYTQPDPISPEMMKQLLHARHIFNPPATEVNAEGHVVDVAASPAPAEQTVAAAAAAATPVAPALPAEATASESDADAGKPRSGDAPA
ncbi:MAG TPA: DUF3306 domain-containing protein [Casimicrobiaceae bacterium]|nr:DUF3306 domain-containing protein [Casimicrobiaceae bacterium]